MCLRPVLGAQTLTPSALLCATWSSISCTPRDSLSPRGASRCRHPRALRAAAQEALQGARYLAQRGRSHAHHGNLDASHPPRLHCQHSAPSPSISQKRRGLQRNRRLPGPRSHFTWAFLALACTASFRFQKTSSLSASLDRSSEREMLACLAVAVPALLPQLRSRLSPAGCSTRERGCGSPRMAPGSKQGLGQEPCSSWEQRSSMPSRSQQTQLLPVPAPCARLPSCAELGAAPQPHSQPCRATCCLPAHGHLPATHTASVARSTGI